MTLKQGAPDGLPRRSYAGSEDQLERLPQPRDENSEDAAEARVSPGGSRWSFVVALLVASVGLAMLGLAWVVSSPAGSYMDEEFHLASIYCPQPLAEHCTVVGQESQGSPIVRVPTAVASAGYCFNGDIRESGECSLTLSNDQSTETSRVNSGLYAGPYYAFMHLFAGHDVDSSVLAVRAANFIIAVLMLGGILIVSSPENRRIGGYALALTAIPITLPTIASINPGAWGVVGVFGYWLALLGFFRSPPGRRRVALGVFMALSAVLASSSRADAAAYIAVITIAMLILHWRTVRDKWRVVVLPGILSIVGSAGFLWAGQSSAISSGMGFGSLYPAIPGNPLRLLAVNILQLWPYLGSLWSWIPMYVVAPAFSGLTVALCLFSIGAIAVKTASWGAPKVIAVVLVGGAMVGSPLLVLQAGHNTFSQGPIQARYLLPLFIVLVGLLFTGQSEGRPARLGRPAKWFLVLALTLAHAFLLWAVIRRYTTGTDVPGFNLDTVVEWWRGVGGLSPLATWIVGSLGFVLTGSLLLGPFEHSRPLRRSKVPADLPKP